MRCRGLEMEVQQRPLLRTTVRQTDRESDEVIWLSKL